MNRTAKSAKTPVIAVTLGDPSGIGAEVLVKALGRRAPGDPVRLLVIGSLMAWKRALEITGIDLPYTMVRSADDAGAPEPPAPGIRVLSPLELREEDITPGEPSAAACQLTVRSIELAVRLALAGKVDAVCTGPIHKENLHKHGFAFPGHTEFLQHLSNSEDVVMMLAGPRLKVALATIHVALGDVPRLLDRERLCRTIAIVGHSLRRDFGLRQPRIAVAGLNPHAGEGGRFGDEESAIIEPAIASFAQAPFQVSGPYPPDTVFHRAYHRQFDAVVAMYHDQGLIPLKLVHFDCAVNVTLGLPIIRTSVDHGTAYDIAGTGRADPGSMEEALRLAALMAHNRARVRDDS